MRMSRLKVVSGSFDSQAEVNVYYKEMDAGRLPTGTNNLPDRPRQMLEAHLAYMLRTGGYNT
jgi:hypothetical protein